MPIHTQARKLSRITPSGAATLSDCQCALRSLARQSHDVDGRSLAAPFAYQRTRGRVCPDPAVPGQRDTLIGDPRVLPAMVDPDNDHPHAAPQSGLQCAARTLPVV